MKDYVEISVSMCYYENNQTYCFIKSGSEYSRVRKVLSVMIKYEINETDKKLIEIGLDVLKQNFDDGVYNHTVGCALLCKNGNIYKGVNCDGIHGSCAEYVTMGIAISAGEREFDTIVAVHDKHLNFVIPPCGNCRQMMFEYCPDIKVIVNDENGKVIKVSARDLLPFAWQPVVCE